MLTRSGDVKGAVGVLPQENQFTDTLSKQLEHHLKALEPLEQQVRDGQVVPNFGEKADRIIASTKGAQHKKELEIVLDGALRSLFSKQLVLLRQRTHRSATASSFAATARDALAKADSQFVAAATALCRPSGPHFWSFEADRHALRVSLEGVFRREAALAEEKALLGQSFRVAQGTLASLQREIMQLQQQVRQPRPRSPWVVSASYSVPRTPLQLVGRLQQGGRANVELSLSPDNDPVVADAGMVKGFSPANLGVNFNVNV